MPDSIVEIPARRLLTPTEVAELLHVSPAWVRDHATRRQPHLAAVRLGKLLRFRPEDVEDFITTCLALEKSA